MQVCSVDAGRCLLHLALPGSPELSDPGRKLHSGSPVRSRTQAPKAEKVLLSRELPAVERP